MSSKHGAKLTHRKGLKDLEAASLSAEKQKAYSDAAPVLQCDSPGRPKVNFAER